MDMSTQQEIQSLRDQLADVQTRLQHIIIADDPSSAACTYLQELQASARAIQENSMETIYEGMTAQGFEVAVQTNGKTLEVVVNSRYLITFGFNPTERQDAIAFARLLCVTRKITVQK